MADYSQYVKQASQTYGVSENLINAVIQQESGGNPAAVSSAGAVGLMQLMPGTAAEMGVSDRYDPEQNIMGGTKYLSILSEKYNGDEESALAAYFAGSGNVDKYGKEKYSAYYEGVFSKMESSHESGSFSNTASGTKTGLFSGGGSLMETIVTIVCVIGLALLAVVFLYYTVNNI